MSLMKIRLQTQLSHHPQLQQQHHHKQLQEEDRQQRKNIIQIQPTIFTAMVETARMMRNILILR